MTTATGTATIDTLLAARFQSAAEYGLDTIQEILQADIDAHNTIVNQMVGQMCEITTDRQRIYGTSVGGEMIDVDEFGRAPGQISKPGATCGFPLNQKQYALGWTEKWTQTHTPADMAILTQAAEKAHLKAIQKEIKKAVYLSANYTFRDHLVDTIDLSVRRFVNADSTAIPDGPNGETFDGATHTHYDGAASLTAAVHLANVQDVIEHGHGGNVLTAISKTDEAAFRALTGFVAYPDPRVIANIAADHGAKTLDISRLDNRAIGVLNGAEIWVKPWAIANYLFSWDVASPLKPLAFRQRTAQSLQGLRIAAQLAAYPLFAQFMEAEYGIAVWTRTNGCVTYFANATYADPTIS